MTKYFLEIKNRLLLTLLTCISVFLISYFYKETLLFLIVQPSIFKNYNKSLSFFYFIFTDVTEILSIYLDLLKFLTLQIFFSFIIYHFFIFISSALFQFEYKKLKLHLKNFLYAWLSSAFISSYYLIPSTWNFFLSFQSLHSNYSFNLHFEAKLSEYISLYISFYYIFGFYVEFFIFILMILTSLKFYSNYLKKFRKFLYYCFIILSTSITPPEVTSQCLISLITIIIYEFLGFFLILKNKLIHKRIETH